MVNWDAYLESLCTVYAQWWKAYTLTDVIGHQRVEPELLPPLFDFDLMVQTIQPAKNPAKRSRKPSD